MEDSRSIFKISLLFVYGLDFKIYGHENTFSNSRCSFMGFIVLVQDYNETIIVTKKILKAHVLYAL